jgi:polysaccharide export outer membrane protein
MKLKPACMALAMVLSGCAGTPLPTSSASLQVVSATELPRPTVGDQYASNQSFAIAPLDRLRIDVYGMQELSQRIVQVDSNGQIAFPFAGTLDVGGKTPAEVSTMIDRALRANYVRDPQVTVNLEQAAPRGVTVYGEVREPGVYPVSGRMTLMRAIASAKGLGEFASQDEVVVFRSVNGQNLAAIYSMNAIRSGAYPDPEIFSNDVIAVGDSPARRAFRDVINAAGLITTPLILLLQNNN